MPSRSPSTSMGRMRRFSEMFGQKKDKSSTTLAPGDVSSNTADSAYASSETTAPSRSDLTPLENNGQIKGVSSDRNLTVNKLNGDVTDDSGTVVSTVTTTTTTTTTTTVGGKKEQKQDVQVVEGTPQTQQTEMDTRPTSSAVPASAHTYNANRDSMISEMPAEPFYSENNSTNNSTDTAVPLSAAPNSNLAASDAPVSPVMTSQTTLANNPPEIPTSPAVPPRNPYRRSGELQAHERHDVTASSIGSSERLGSSQGQPKPNFSRPGRGSTDGGTALVSNLKAAVKGLHGVGETLRGTLNNELDSRIPRSDPEKQAIAEAKNRAALEKGRREMEGLGHPSANDPAPVATYTPAKRSQSIPRRPVPDSASYDLGAPSAANPAPVATYTPSADGSKALPPAPPTASVAHSPYVEGLGAPSAVDPAPATTYAPNTASSAQYDEQGVQPRSSKSKLARIPFASFLKKKSSASGSSTSLPQGEGSEFAEEQRPRTPRRLSKVMKVSK